MNLDLPFTLKVFDALPIYGILFCADGTIVTATATFLDTVGLHREEITGMSVDGLRPYFIDIKEQFTAAVISCGTRSFPARLMQPNGEMLAVDHTLTHITGPDREMIASISHTIDRPTAGEDAEEAEKKIEAAHRRKRQFIANINHEIRTPMNAIVGYAEMLAESELGEQQRRFVDTIRKNSAALISIINDMTELSKLEAGRVKVQKATVDLRVIVEQLQDLFEEQIRLKKIAFSCMIDPSLHRQYLIDADHCRQILSNLLSNAVKYTDRGKITLSVTGNRISAKQYILSFLVTDTGRGMTMKEQTELAELFARQKEGVSFHDGKRLGLTLSARLARIMGGELAVESVKKRGSMFTLTLPAAAAETVPGTGSAGQRADRKKTKSKQQPVILVVDDMPEMSNLVKIYFSGSPIQVIEAADQEACLRHAFSSPPDLILMDLDLAGTDGRDITRQLRENPVTKDVPVVVMTGLMMEKSTCGPLFDDFLPKPFHLHELRQLVDKYIQVKPHTHTAELAAAEQDASFVEPELIRQFWNEELEAAYTAAEMSGSLDTAAELGRKMQEHGVRNTASALTETGAKLQQCARDLDIQSVDRILTALRTTAGKTGETGKES